MCTFISSMHTFISCFKGCLFDTGNELLFSSFSKSFVRILLFPLKSKIYNYFYFSLVAVDFWNELYICFYLYYFYMYYIWSNISVSPLWLNFSNEMFFFTFHCRYIKKNSKLYDAFVYTKYNMCYYELIY